jgi:hypothetical protein
LPRDPVFSGREDTLASIRQALLAPINEPEDSSGSVGGMIPALSAYSLCGPGGMGESSIANGFVHRYEKEFDAVFWVTADEETKPFDSLREIALKLGIISEADGKDLPAIRETLLAWLANPLRSYQHMDHAKPDYASWLIVFDNVERADTLDDFWPKEAAGSVLVTCRDPFIKGSIYLRNTGFTVPELLEEEGVSLLLRITGRESDEEDIKQAPDVARPSPLRKCPESSLLETSVSRSFSTYTQRRQNEGRCLVSQKGSRLLFGDTIGRSARYGP